MSFLWVIFAWKFFFLLNNIYLCYVVIKCRNAKDFFINEKNYTIRTYTTPVFEQL